MNQVDRITHAADGHDPPLANEGAPYLPQEEARIEPDDEQWRRPTAIRPGGSGSRRDPPTARVPRHPRRAHSPSIRIRAPARQCASCRSASRKPAKKNCEKFARLTVSAEGPRLSTTEESQAPPIHGDEDRQASHPRPGRAEHEREQRHHEIELHLDFEAPGHPTDPAGLAEDRPVEVAEARQEVRQGIAPTFFGPQEDREADRDAQQVGRLKTEQPAQVVRAERRTGCAAPVVRHVGKREHEPADREEERDTEVPGVGESDRRRSRNTSHQPPEIATGPRRPLFPR